MVDPQDNFVGLFVFPIIGSRVHLPTTTSSEGRGLRTGATWPTRYARWLPWLLGPPIGQKFDASFGRRGRAVSKTKGPLLVTLNDTVAGRLVPPTSG